jgi:alpha 1,2-mannosyltransferase
MNFCRNIGITGESSEQPRLTFPDRDALIGPLRPDVKFFCDLEYDPFLIMQDQNKVYGAHQTQCLRLYPAHFGVPGFTVSLYEYEATIPTLWEATKGPLAQAIWTLHTLNFFRIHKRQP